MKKLILFYLLLQPLLAKTQSISNGWKIQYEGYPSALGGYQADDGLKSLNDYFNGRIYVASLNPGFRTFLKPAWQGEYMRTIAPKYGDIFLASSNMVGEAYKGTVVSSPNSSDYLIGLTHNGKFLILSFKTDGDSISLDTFTKKYIVNKVYPNTQNTIAFYDTNLKIQKHYSIYSASNYSPMAFVSASDSFIFTMVSFFSSGSKDIFLNNKKVTIDSGNCSLLCINIYTDSVLWHTEFSGYFGAYGGGNEVNPKSDKFITIPIQTLKGANLKVFKKKVTISELQHSGNPTSNNIFLLKINLSNGTVLKHQNIYTQQNTELKIDAIRNSLSGTVLLSHFNNFNTLSGSGIYGTNSFLNKEGEVISFLDADLNFVKNIYFENQFFLSRAPSTSATISDIINDSTVYILSNMDSFVRIKNYYEKSFGFKDAMYSNQISMALLFKFNMKGKLKETNFFRAAPSPPFYSLKLFDFNLKHINNQNFLYTFKQVGKVYLNNFNSLNNSQYMDLGSVGVHSFIVNCKPIAYFKISQTSEKATLYTNSSVENNIKWVINNVVIKDSIFFTRSFAKNSNNNIKLVLSNACGSDSISQTFFFAAGITPLQPSFFTVYPNPTPHKLWIDVSENLPGALNLNKVSVEVLDLAGKIISNSFSQIGNNKLELNTENLSPGIYIVRIGHQNSFVNLKFVKANP